jgi:hypothetical protein
MHELEPQGSHVRFRPFSAGSGLPNVRGPGSCAYGHPDTNCDHYTDADFVSAIANTDRDSYADSHRNCNVHSDPANSTNTDSAPEAHNNSPAA